MIQLYAVTDATVDPPPGLSALDAGQVRVLYRECETAPTADREELLEFGREVREITRRCTALPVRYGTTVDTVADLELLAAQSGPGWEERLRAVAGAAELIVHVSLPDAGDAPRSSGRDYLLHRASVLHERSAVVEELTGTVSRWARERRELSGDGPARLAVLTDVDDIEPLVAAVGGWADSHPGVSVEVTGPWPPFSFCEEPA